MPFNGRAVKLCFLPQMNQALTQTISYTILKQGAVLTVMSHPQHTNCIAGQWGAALRVLAKRLCPAGLMLPRTEHSGNALAASLQMPHHLALYPLGEQRRVGPVTRFGYIKGVMVIALKSNPSV